VRLAGGPAAVVGVGSTPISRRTEQSLASLAVEAALAAVHDAGIEMSEIDCYVGSPTAPNKSAAHVDGIDEVSGLFLTHALGLRPKWSADLFAMPAVAVAAAAQALVSARLNYALFVRALYNPVDRRYSYAGEAEAYGRDQFTLPYGAGPGGTRHALWLARYLDQHGATREDLYTLVATQRAHAQLNPAAYWRDVPLSIDDYMSARWVCEPMCVFDCDLPVTGAVALVLASPQNAGSHEHAAYVLGYAGGRRPEAVLDDLRLRPTDVQVCQLYDGFSPFVWMWLERFGFCEAGTAFRFTRDGNTQLGGVLPTNTFGGSLGEGRLHGIGHVREAALQVMGRAGERQVASIDHSLAVVGVGEDAGAIVFGPEPRT
jgi:acetyl-CoA acetyltransferase